MAVDWAGYGYAALVASGGVLGYVKAGSVPSLAAGVLFGGLAGFGAYQISQNPKNIWVSLATSGTLAAIMGNRFYNSRKIMPAGIVAGARYLLHPPQQDSAPGHSEISELFLSFAGVIHTKLSYTISTTVVLTMILIITDVYCQIRN
uniref:Transmembrane protein 14C n=1 Tax=Pygocentrus nattereri TaxID=42514 RepID=A0AAR2LYR1_PYGNA